MKMNEDRNKKERWPTALIIYVWMNIMGTTKKQERINIEGNLTIINCAVMTGYKYTMSYWISDIIIIIAVRVKSKTIGIDPNLRRRMNERKFEMKLPEH